MSYNDLKYLRIDPILRAELRQQWNQPVRWPVIILLAVLVLAIIPVCIHYWRKEHQSWKSKKY